MPEPEKTAPWCGFLRHVLYVVFLCEGFAALVFSIDSISPRVSIKWAGLFAIILFAAICVGARFLPERGGTKANSEQNWTAFFWGILCLGVVVRIVWLVSVPPVQTSDYARYLTAARNLLDTGTYTEYLRGLRFRAFTPCGWPLVLAAGIRVLGDRSWTPAILNLGAYAGASLLLYRLSARLAGKRAAVWATLIIALWPSNVLMTGLAASEPLFVLFFLAGCFLLFLPDSISLRCAPLCGISTGFAALTRPTALTLPVVWLAACLIWGKPLGKRLKAMVLASLFTALTVAPWTIRNYRVLGAFVPVSTNGGDVFYRANNPVATGTWTARGERDLSQYMGNEVRWNQVGFAWGKEWIRSHPAKFLKLAVEKQFVFLGSDETGAYWAVARAYPDKHSLYNMTLAASDLWWLLIWIAVLFALVRYRMLFLKTPPLLCLLLPVLYFLGIHSIFESQSRYHIPVVPFLIVVVVLAFIPAYDFRQE